jgi:hypothetical protein
MTITRDDLHNNASVNSAGVFYSGEATFVGVRPKGNGNQNGLTINGQPFALANGSKYDITADQMAVVVYNDKVKSNGKGMGHWWITINATNVTIMEEGSVVIGGSTSGPAARLIEVDPKTAAVQDVMTLGRVYDGLAADGGGRFVATCGAELWGLDPVAATETLLGSMEHDQVKGLEFAGSALHGFAVVNDRLVPFNASSGATAGSLADIEAVDLTGIVFMRLADAPTVNVMD